MYKENISFDNESLAVNKKGIENFNSFVQIFAIWTHDGTENSKRFYTEILENAKREINFSTEINKEKFTALLAIENAKMIESEQDVDELYSHGVRSISLTWNGANKLAGGAASDKDLTDFGKAVIKQMNRKKIATDLSHLNQKSFNSVVEIADYPFASHSCCNFIFKHQRNLDDKSLIKIAEKKGVVGLCFYPEFLGRSDAVSGLIKNIEHMLAIGLEDSIALGSDFDGAKMADNLSDCSKLESLHDYLNSYFGDSCLVDKIFYSNAKQFFSKLLTNT